MKTLTLIDKAFILKMSSLFAELDLELLLPIADKVNTISYEAGNSVFVVGEDAHRMYFLVRGKINIRNREGQQIGTVEAPDFFGDESLFNDQPRQYTATCQSDVLLLALSKTHLVAIISESPNVAIGLLQAYASSAPFRNRK